MKAMSRYFSIKVGDRERSLKGLGGGTNIHIRVHVNRPQKHSISKEKKC